MRDTSRWLFLVLALLLVVGGCKKSTGGSSGSSSANGGAGDNASATGAGAVNVVGKVVTYQNVHIEVPWDVSDISAVVKMSQEAAGGKGLRLSDGKTTLVIASDGKSMHLNDKPYGELRPGDKVVLTKEGKVTVNGIERGEGK